MARARKIPAYTLHAPSGQARVRINGKDHYLGPHKSEASRKKYDRLIAKYLADDDRPTEPGVTISQIMVMFWRHAKVRYGNSGKGKYGAAINWRPIIRLVRKRYGKRIAEDFGPKALRNLRNRMVDLKWSRKYINCQLARTKQIFKWAVAEELIPERVYRRLTTVPGFRRGESEATERKPIGAVNDAVVNLTVPLLSPVVAAMVRFQRYTGARPVEVCTIRPSDVNRTGEVWTYVPGKHKTEHHEKSRVIYIGPKAQEILLPYLLRGPNDYCFPANRRRRKYTTDSYRRAIHRACEANNIPKWSPNQLRHAAATGVRAEFGLETASAMLGHSNLKTSEIYAANDKEKAMAAAKKLG